MDKEPKDPRPAEQPKRPSKPQPVACNHCKDGKMIKEQAGPYVGYKCDKCRYYERETPQNAARLRYK